ncbi:MAG: hypothetical protein JSR28_08765, partial [Proteobacteria bacterium]|nr:hypothetical protein [Pseudomonadota bacterium]
MQRRPIDRNGHQNGDRTRKEAPLSSAIVTADLFDAHHASVQVCELQFRSHGKRRSFSGPCRTLRVSEDHVPVRDILSTPGQGHVLVVDGAGVLRTGIL